MSEKKKTLKFKEEELFLQISQYRNNGNLAILAYTKEEPYGNITINLSEYCLDKNEGFIDPIIKYFGLEDELIKKGIIKEIKSTVKYNMGEYDWSVFDMEKLKEYDSEGMEKYKKLIEKEEEFE